MSSHNGTMGTTAIPRKVARVVILFLLLRVPFTVLDSFQLPLTVAFALLTTIRSAIICLIHLLHSLKFATILFSLHLFLAINQTLLSIKLLSCGLGFLKAIFVLLRLTATLGEPFIVELHFLHASCKLIFRQFWLPNVSLLSRIFSAEV